MTDFKTAKKPEVKPYTYPITIPGGAKIIGEGQTPEAAKRDAEGKAAFLSARR